MKRAKQPALQWFTIFSVLLLALTLSCSGSNGKKPEEATQGESIAHAKDLPAALVLAKKENKIILAELYDHGCAYCKYMQGVLKDKAVRDAMKGVILVKLFKQNQDFIEKFGLLMSPAFVFYKPDGTPMEPVMEGFRSPPRFSAEINNYKLKAQGKPELPLAEDEHPNFGKG